MLGTFHEIDERVWCLNARIKYTVADQIDRVLFQHFADGWFRLSLNDPVKEAWLGTSEQLKKMMREQ